MIQKDRAPAMHANIKTVAFRGIDTIPVEVQVHVANGLPAMAIVGLADKAVAREFADTAGHRGADDPVASMSGDARALLESAIETQSLTARGFHRVVRVGRTIADLERSAGIERRHLAEALAYRAMPLLA